MTQNRKIRIKIVLLLLCSLLILSMGCENRAEKSTRHREKGIAYLQKGDTQGALLEFKNLVELVPESGEAHFLLGQVYSRTKNFHAAFDEYEEAISKGWNTYDLHLRMAEASHFLGKTERAGKEIGICLQQRKDDPMIYLLLGMMDVQKHDLRNAHTQFQHALTIDPDFQPALLEEGLLYLREHALEKALSYLNQAQKNQPEDIRPLMALGNLFTEEGKIDQALSVLQAARAIKPDFFPVHLKLGALYLKQGKYDDAISEGKEALHLAPKSLKPHFILGTGYFGRKEFDQAEKEILLFIQNDPQPPLPYLILAEIYLQGHKLQQALTYAQKTLEYSPNHSKAHLIAGICSLTQNWMEDAVKHFKAVTEVEPKNIQALNLLAISYTKEGRLDEALETFKKALTLNPDSPQTHENFADYYGFVGNLDRAIEELQKSLELSPDRMAADIRLILTYLKKGDYPKAIETGKQGLKKYGENAVLFNLLGAAYGGKKDTEKAIAYYDEAIKKKKDFLAPYLNKSNLLKESNRLDEALRCCSRAAEEIPDHPMPHLCAGKLYTSMEQPDKAIVEYNRALALDASLLSARSRLAEIYLQQHDLTAAAREFRQILSQAPEDVAALNNLAWIYAEKEQNLAEALAMTEKAVRLKPNEAGFQDTLGWVLYKKGQL